MLLMVPYKRVHSEGSLRVLSRCLVSLKCSISNVGTQSTMSISQYSRLKISPPFSVNLGEILHLLKGRNAEIVFFSFFFKRREGRVFTIIGSCSKRRLNFTSTGILWT